VGQGVVPRFVYTVGLRKKIGAELVFAGASSQTAAEVQQLINATAASVGRSTAILRKVDSSWVKLLLLGAIDYFEDDAVPALQVMPDQAHWTIEVPDLEKPFSADSEPVWQWLTNPWTLPIPKDSTAVTNMAALRGERITEAVRWEQEEWELFAGSGPDTPKSDMRVIPFATLYGVDTTLGVLASLPMGAAVWRLPHEQEWRDWSRPAG
jgi:hypothetical protein